MCLIVALTSCQQADQQGKVAWKPYSKQALADSIKENKPVVIDFFAEWCPSCHELDRTVFSDPSIAAKLAKVTTLRMDATDMDAQNVQSVLQDYGIEGLPTVVFLDSHGQEIANSRIIGAASPKEFSEVLALLAIFR